MPDRMMDVVQILAVLRETPNHLAALTASATVAELRTVPVEGEWSAVEVLAHLRSCSDMWGQAIEAIVTEDHPTLRAVNPTTWIESTDYRELEFRPSLQVFTSQRSRLLDVLESLSPDGWCRDATVLGAGKPMRRTVQDYADRLARHERVHWKQVEKTVHAVVGDLGT